MKTLSVVTLSLLAISLFFLDEGQNKKLRMYNDAKFIKEPIRMIFDAKAMKEEILKQVPIGSSIYDAKIIMEKNCFKCAMYKNSGFLEKGDSYGNDPLGKKDISHEGVDFLYCGNDEASGLYVMKEWMVMIVHQNEVVSNVYVNTGLTGP